MERPFCVDAADTKSHSSHCEQTLGLRGNSFLCHIDQREISLLYVGFLKIPHPDCIGIRNDNCYNYDTGCKSGTLDLKGYDRKTSLTHYISSISELLKPLSEQYFKTCRNRRFKMHAFAGGRVEKFQNPGMQPQTADRIG